MENLFLCVGEESINFPIGLLRRLRMDDSEAIHHAMNMCVDPYVWCIIEDR